MTISPYNKLNVMRSSNFNNKLIQFYTMTVRLCCLCEFIFLLFNC